MISQVDEIRSSILSPMGNPDQDEGKGIVWEVCSPTAGTGVSESFNELAEAATSAGCSVVRLFGSVQAPPDVTPHSRACVAEAKRVLASGSPSLIIVDGVDEWGVGRRDLLQTINDWGRLLSRHQSIVYSSRVEMRWSAFTDDRIIRRSVESTERFFNGSRPLYELVAPANRDAPDDELEAYLDDAVWRCLAEAMTCDTTGGEALSRLLAALTLRGEPSISVVALGKLLGSHRSNLGQLRGALEPLLASKGSGSALRILHVRISESIKRLWETLSFGVGFHEAQIEATVELVSFLVQGNGRGGSVGESSSLAVSLLAPLLSGGESTFTQRVSLSGAVEGVLGRLPPDPASREGQQSIASLRRREFRLQSGLLLADLPVPPDFQPDFSTKEEARKLRDCGCRGEYVKALEDAGFRGYATALARLDEPSSITVPIVLTAKSDENAHIEVEYDGARHEVESPGQLWPRVAKLRLLYLPEPPELRLREADQSKPVWTHLRPEVAVPDALGPPDRRLLSARPGVRIVREVKAKARSRQVGAVDGWRLHGRWPANENQSTYAAEVHKKVFDLGDQPTRGLVIRLHGDIGADGLKLTDSASRNGRAPSQIEVSEVMGWVEAAGSEVVVLGICYSATCCKSQQKWLEDHWRGGPCGGAVLASKLIEKTQARIVVGFDSEVEWFDVVNWLGRLPPPGAILEEGVGGLWDAWRSCGLTASAMKGAPVVYRRIESE